MVWCGACEAECESKVTVTVGMMNLPCLSRCWSCAFVCVRVCVCADVRCAHARVLWKSTSSLVLPMPRGAFGRFGTSAKLRTARSFDRSLARWRIHAGGFCQLLCSAFVVERRTTPFVGDATRIRIVNKQLNEPKYIRVGVGRGACVRMRSRPHPSAE